jgi:uncharacterized membrane protein YczE
MITRFDRLFATASRAMVLIAAFVDFWIAMAEVAAGRTMAAAIQIVLAIVLLCAGIAVHVRWRALLESAKRG